MTSGLRRGVARAVALGSALPAVLVGLVVLGLFIPRGPETRPAGEPRHTVWIAASPIHTDLVLPASAAILRRFDFLNRDGLALDHPALATLVIGWGGRAFYTQTPRWADLGMEAVWRSVTRDRSVLHVALGGAPTEGPGMRRIDLSDAALKDLLGFVEAGFEPGADGAPQVLAGAGYSPFDRFYEARGAFNLLFGCNTWTAAALRAAGLRTAAWTPLPPTLLWGLDLHASR